MADEDKTQNSQQSSLQTATANTSNDEDIESTKTKNPNKLMTLFSRIESFAGDNIRDMPGVRNLDDKLSTTIKRVILAILVVLFIIVIAIILSKAFKKKPSYEVSQEILQNVSKEEQLNNLADEKQSSISSMMPNITTKAPIVDNQSLEALIQKADILYKTGNKQEGLNLFNQIAAYSKSIANYNLGVINASAKEYKKSMEYYDKAIEAGEDVALSAINAAVSAFRAGNMNKYSYYLNIANSYANKMSNLPPYSYTYALNQYYQGQYFEALSPLSHDENNGFDKDSKRLAAKLYTLFNDNTQAYNNLKAVAQRQDELALGQLLARQGNLNAARGHIHTYLMQYPNDWYGKMSMQIVSLKLGDFAQAAGLIDEFANMKRKENIANPYPIKARVSPMMFDIEIAQREFWNRSFEHSNLWTSKILFYYAPYRVLDAREALNIISAGVLDSKINQNSLEESQAVLARGATISLINVSIAQALKRINQNDVHGGLDLLQKYVEQNPNHAVLHYNLGLLYAQIGDIPNAYKHFLRAYHLDMTDLQAGIFALIAGKLIYKDVSMISQNLATSILDSELPPDELDFYRKLKDWGNNPQNVAVYMPSKNETRPIDFAFQSISAMHKNDRANIISGFEMLKKAQPRDIVANILLDLAKNYGKNVKNSVLNMQYLFRENLDLDSVFYGPNLARELYIYVGFITGNLAKQKDELNKKLSTQLKNPNGLLQALALLNIYQKNFEESYTMYDKLINSLGQDDANTRLLGALAAIGANHKNAATLLLQLSKMESSVNYESKYALGLLYQERENYNAAAQHYNSIGTKGFHSEYLDFVIDDEHVSVPE